MHVGSFFASVLCHLVVLVEGSLVGVSRAYDNAPDSGPLSDSGVLSDHNPAVRSSVQFWSSVANNFPRCAPASPSERPNDYCLLPLQDSHFHLQRRMLSLFRKLSTLNSHESLSFARSSHWHHEDVERGHKNYKPVQQQTTQNS